MAHTSLYTVTLRDSVRSLFIVPVTILHLETSIVYYETRVEAGSITSTVTLRVVGGDEKGSLKSETVKYGHES
jgi:hypothetical protein